VGTRRNPRKNGDRRGETSPGERAVGAPKSEITEDQYGSSTSTSRTTRKRRSPGATIASKAARYGAASPSDFSLSHFTFFITIGIAM